jgi:calnexin
MKFNKAAAIFGTALLAGCAYADDAQKVLADDGSSPADPESSSPVAPELPTFTVSSPSPIAVRST